MMVFEPSNYVLDGCVLELGAKNFGRNNSLGVASKCSVYTKGGGSEPGIILVSEWAANQRAAGCPGQRPTPRAKANSGARHYDATMLLMHELGEENGWM